MRLASAFVLLCAATSFGDQPASDLAAYSLTWSTPGPDASASMPIGNGELGLNLWTEPNADIAFYLSRTDSWSEASRLLKLARVRISFDPPLLQPGREFSQKLDLARGVIRISSSIPGDECVIEVFVHPDQPVAYVCGFAHTPRHIKVSLETWRTERKQLSGTGPDAELTSSWTMHDAPMEVWESADRVLDDPSRLVWLHRNEDSVVPLSIEHQGLESIAASIPDVLLHRTFGGAIMAGPEGFFRKTSSTTLESNGPRERFDIRVVGHTEQTPTAEAWVGQLDALATASPDPAAAQARTEEWWREFWDRSYIFVDGDPSPAVGVPVNTLPITLGQDSAGGNRYRGEINRVGMYAKVYDDAGVLRMARGRLDQAPPFRQRAVSFVSTDEPGKTAPPSAPREFPDGFTLDAWIKPAPDLESARILDKVTPGKPDGFLFDIQPGGTLRLIVGEKTLASPGAVKLGQWNRLAATYDPAVDQLRLFAGGHEVAASERNENLTPSPITCGYILQRWMQACAGRGGAPIKFNGSIFTVDAKYTNGVDASPDYRRWGDCFWWQNTRLPYHAMLAAGDFEMMDPLFDLYTRVLPACEARAALYHNVKGAYFPETMNIFGLYANADYGWDRSGHEPNEVLCPWWQWAWNQGLELVSLMLDRYDYTQDDAFASDRLVPMARSVLLYFDTRFQRDDNGKLVISPTQALETHWHGVVNDMPVVAGLHDVTSRLLALPDSVGSPEDRALWERIHAALPPIPTREADGVKLFAPAATYDPSRQNVETPELANVFPHRLVGLGSPNEELEAARETYRRRHDRSTQGWTQDGQFAALLGLTDEAKANIVAKAANSNPKHRFPAMWGPNFDWLPDQTHGGNLMHLLQCMLIQPRGDKILLLPAWPPEWNVSFKLHAPKNTVVEGEYRDGKMVRLEVTPESRRGDVQLMTGE